MSTFYDCLEICLSSRQGKKPPLAVCIGWEGDPDDWEDRELYSLVVPPGWRVQWVDFEAWADWTPPPDEDGLLLVAPVVRTGAAATASDLGVDGWKEDPPLLTAALLRAVRRARPGQRIAALIPDDSFAASYPEPREHLLREADLILLAEAEETWRRELGIDDLSRVALLCIERRAADAKRQPSRFLRLPRRSDSMQIAEELRALFRLGGGQTDHGFVQREAIETRRPLRVAAHDPARLERQRHLRSLGEVRMLGDLGRLFVGWHRPSNSSGPEPVDGVPVLTGRDIATGVALDYADVRRVVRPARRAVLAAGDLCVPVEARRGEPLRVHVVEHDELPLVAANTVIAIRPRDELDTATIQFLVDYLRSPRAAALLAHETSGRPHLDASQLAQLPVPMPDDTLLSALADLRATERQLDEWAAEVSNAIAGVLGEDAAEAGVIQLRSTGQLLRHRVTAARQLDDLGYRIRNLFPFPVALPWRRAQTANADLEGYQGILECAESLTGYLAVLSILLSRDLELELGAVRGLRNGLATTDHGISMTEWTEIVREVAGKRVARTASAATPFVELTELMLDGGDAYEALRDLTQMRNDLSHNRGPKGGQVPGSFSEALERLVELYEACEWLIEYPVRLVEDTTWDSYGQSGRYRYRELTGDHYLIRPRTAATTDPTLNKGRLYVTDRTEKMHLVSPLILWHECDHCNLPSAFFLDAFDRKARSCRMRAMDHHHTIQRVDVVEPLVSLGVLPA